LVGNRRRDAASKGVEAAYQRYHGYGDQVTYEWSVPVFTDFDELPIDLTDAGRAIGFDLVVVDKQTNGHRWIPWGNSAEQKFHGPDRVGTLVLSTERAFMPWWSSVGSVASTLGQILLYGIGALAVVAGGMALRNVALPPAEGGRLIEIEKRLTDTQDILLALNEKCERLERRFNETQGTDAAAESGEES